MTNLILENKLPSVKDQGHTDCFIILASPNPDDTLSLGLSITFIFNPLAKRTDMIDRITFPSNAVGNYFFPGAEYCDEYCDEFVCVSVCLRAYLGNYTSSINQIFVHAIGSCGSVLLSGALRCVNTPGLVIISFAHVMRHL